MTTLILTMPELEQAARQWAVDFLHVPWESVTVLTALSEAQQVRWEGCEILVYQQTLAPMLRHVLQNGGCPWLLTQLVKRSALAACAA